MRPFQFLQEPRGRAFDAILRFAQEHCPVLSVDESEVDSWPELDTFRVAEDENNRWRAQFAGRDFFVVSEESLAWLGALGGLYEGPDDLTFHVTDGSSLVTCIAHEGEGWCDPTCLPETVVRPLIEELHALNVGPPPNAKRNVMPYRFPDLSLDELREIFTREIRSAKVKSMIDEIEQGNFVEEKLYGTRLSAFEDYWNRRLARPAKVAFQSSNGAWLVDVRG